MAVRKNMFHGEKVRQIIGDKGLTATEVAIQVGIKRELMSNYINGRRNPKRGVVQRIADALHVPITDISGYDLEVSVPQVAEKFTDSDALLTDVCRFVAAELSRQVQMTNQLNVARSIGMSHTTVNRIINGVSDIRDFPLSALVKLCPQIINRAALNGNTDEAELACVIENIKRLAGEIRDLATAKTVETMMKGLVGE